MRVVRDFFLLLVSLAFAGAMLTPLCLQELPAPQEAWVIQSVSELHDAFQLVPTLNGQPLSGHNPLSLLLLSTIPSDNPAALRLMSLALGLLLCYGVFVYCRRLYGASGLLAVAVLASSLGFLKVYGTANLTALPATLAVLAFLVFSRAYLNDTRRSRYMLAYLLLGLATLTGGYGYLAFGLLAMGALLLVDLAPEKFSEIKLLSGAILIALLLLSFYLVYRVSGGPDFVKLALNTDNRQGFFKTSWALVKLTLPWLPAVIPAWLTSIRPEQEGRWRRQLPLKVGFVAALIVLFFLPKPDTAVLCLPFAAMLIGGWIKQDLRLEKLARATHWGLLLTGALLFVGALVMLGYQPLMQLDISPEKGAALGAVAVLALLFIILTARRRYAGALTSVMLAALLSSAAYGLLYLPQQLRQPIDYFASVASCQPMVAFSDDLEVRGCLGFVGSDPLVVRREIVPLGQPVYLVASGPELKQLRCDAQTLKNHGSWRLWGFSVSGTTANSAGEKGLSAVSYYGKKPVYGTFRFTQPYYFRS